MNLLFVSIFCIHPPTSTSTSSTEIAGSIREVKSQGKGTIFPYLDEASWTQNYPTGCSPISMSALMVGNYMDWAASL